jgi:hypothetical protein
MGNDITLPTYQKRLRALFSFGLHRGVKEGVHAMDTLVWV